MCGMNWYGFNDIKWYKFFSWINEGCQIGLSMLFNSFLLRFGKNNNRINTNKNI